MTKEPMYDEWIANRRSVTPPSGLTDRVMAVVEERAVQSDQHFGFVDRMNRSWSARYAACVAAVAVGALPFLFVAYAAKMIRF